jgi:hypothetical protein
MTCVVGLIKSGKVFLGSDSAAVDEKGGHIFAQKNPKVFTVGQYGIAFIDSFRMGQILQYDWSPPRFTGNAKALDKFMRTKFIESVKDAFKAGGFGSIGANNGEEDTGGIFLVAVRGTGRLFYIDEDYQVGENIIPYYAEGAGQDYALGSLFTSQNMRDPYKRMELALNAASQFSTAVCPPYHFIEL